MLYFHFVPSPEKVSLANFFPERVGGTNQVESTIPVQFSSVSHDSFLEIFYDNGCTPNPTKMERGRCAMPVGMSAVAVLLSMALVLSMSLPSEAAGSSTAGLSQWGAGLQTRIRAGERRLLSNHTNYTETPAPSATPAKNFEVRFTVSLPYSKADFTADKQTKFKEAVASAAGAARVDVTLKITVSTP